tara:strand:- start:149 stop:658 length:510 start_codon:yes stop_codon:yes gene_type:complete
MNTGTAAGRPTLFSNLPEDSMSSDYPQTKAELAELMAHMMGVTPEEIEASFRGPPDRPAEPTEAEIAAAPEDIERICQCCLKPFMVNHFFAEKFSSENPWNICGRCFDYAGTGDLTLKEEARFPVPPLTPEMRKKVREDNDRLDKILEDWAKREKSQTDEPESPEESPR